jgi:hypothetical protein
MKRTAAIVPICLIACQGFAQTSAEGPADPDMNDYAWGFDVLTSNEASFYSVRLPLEVNQSVTDPELRDAGVYNANGEPVPRIFQPASDDVEQVERNRPVPFVPLYTDIEQISGENIRLLFERRGDYDRLELNTDDAVAAPAQRKVSSYIVDTRQLDEAIEALDLYWTQTPNGFVGQVSVEGSDTLSDWSSLGNGAIADLNENATSIVQRRVKLSKSKHDYLRIRWSELPDAWSLAEISSVYTLGVPGIVREKTMLSHSDIDPTDGGAIYSLNATPKIDQLRIVLPDLNSVITANVFLWSESQQRWYRVADGPWHRIGRGDNIIESAAISIPRARSSRIKVVVTGGQPNTAMQVEVGWRPDTLLFLAQGPAPYTLVAGRAADAQAGYPQQSKYGVQSIAGLATDNTPATTATLGPRRALGGANQMQLKKSTDWRTLILWLGLVLGVGFVGFMAARILRDSKSA